MRYNPLMTAFMGIFLMNLFDVFISHEHMTLENPLCERLFQRQLDPLNELLIFIIVALPPQIFLITLSCITLLVISSTASLSTTQPLDHDNDHRVVHLVFNLDRFRSFQDQIHYLSCSLKKGLQDQDRLCCLYFLEPNQITSILCASTLEIVVQLC